MGSLKMDLMTISKFAVSCAAGKQTISHRKKKMDEKPDISGVLFALTQFSIMAACLLPSEQNKRTKEQVTFVQNLIAAHAKSL